MNKLIIMNPKISFKELAEIQQAELSKQRIFTLEEKRAQSDRVANRSQKSQSINYSYKHILVEEFFNLNRTEQHYIIYSLLTSNKKYHFDSNNRLIFDYLIFGVLNAINLFYKNNANNPIATKDEEIKIYFQSPTYDIKNFGSLENVVNYFAYLITERVKPSYIHDRRYSQIKQTYINIWCEILTNPDKKYIQLHRDMFSLIYAKKIGKNKEDFAYFTLRVSGCNNVCFRINSFNILKNKENISDKLLTELDMKKKKNEKQFIEIRSFKEFNSLVSSSGVDYSAPLTSDNSESKTNIQ